jgi:hypothetical protein
MKQQRPTLNGAHLLLSAFLLFAACENKSESSYIPQKNSASTSFAPSPPPTSTLVAAEQKTLFNGDFAGSANQHKYILNLSNENGIIKGTMSEESQSFLLSGQVSREKLTGVMKYILGDLPFEAYYYGDNIVMQLDKETIAGLKILVAAATEDTEPLFAEDKIVFAEMKK